MNKFLAYALFMGFILNSCASKPPKVIKQVIRDTIVINSITEKFESARIANLDSYKVSAKHYPSKGQDERIRHLIIHYTAIDNESSIRALTNNNVSSHYLISDRDDDTIFVFVDENKRAWHAGLSYWKGVNNINFSSLGIEIVNKGYSASTPSSGKPDLAIVERTFHDYPEFQIKKVAELSRDIIDRYNIEPVNVLGHSDIAPQRKHDPGPKFPWKRLYTEYGIGAWYEDYHKDFYINEFPWSEVDSTQFILSYQQDLEKYGYEIQKTGFWDEQTQKVITAFQYHFRPEKYDGYMDAETWAILKSLILKYRS